MSADATTIAVFILIVVITLGITAWASRRNKDTSHHYAAGGEIKGWQNGLALTGDYLSAATFLGYTGLIAVAGFSAFYLMVGATVGLLIMLVLIAEPLRNLGRYTIGDALTSRFNTTWVRSVAAIGTIAISIPYLITQLVGAGSLFELLIGVDFAAAVIVIGVLIAIYITAGGMVAATWIQVVKAVLLLSAFFVITLLVLSRFSFNPIAVFNEAEAQLGASMIAPSHGTLEGLGWMSFGLALFLGVPGLPHVLIRFFTVPDAKAARSSLAVMIWLSALAIATVPVIGYGAAILVGQDAIAEAGAEGNMAVPLLAEVLGGSVLFAYVSAITFATILAVMAGLVIAASGAFAHDLYNKVIWGGEASEREQLRAGRIAAALIVIVSILLSLGLQNVNLAILVAVPLVIAASANTPVILLTLYWKRFNTSGAIIGMLTGLAASIGLMLLGPTAMGGSAPFPLENPALASVPLGFLGCYLGTVLSGSRAREEREQGRQIPYEEIHVRSNTGITNVEEELEGAAAGQESRT